MTPEPPQNPIGPFSPPETFSETARERLTSEIANLPSLLKESVADLSGPQLDLKYRNWTIRQIVHHIADSHINSYVRFKWTLTENKPTIKAYDEGLWSELEESRTGDVAPSLALIEGLHLRWAQLLDSLDDAQLDRAFHHPESGETVSLKSAVAYYAWHGQHHTGQIRWVRQTRQV